MQRRTASLPAGMQCIPPRNLDKLYNVLTAMLVTKQSVAVTVFEYHTPHKAILLQGYETRYCLENPSASKQQHKFRRFLLCIFTERLCEWFRGPLFLLYINYFSVTWVSIFLLTNKLNQYHITAFLALQLGRGWENILSQLYLSSAVVTLSLKNLPRLYLGNRKV